MEYKRLGQTGLKVSRICLGMMSYGTPLWRDWILTEEQARPLIRQAVEGGINFFDTANIYSLGVSEEITGRLLREHFPSRDEYVLATKLYFNMKDGKPNAGGLSRKHVMDAVDASLRRLGTDYIDLYQVHRWDYETPIEETMEALHDVVKAGKARYIGASSMHAWQFAKAQTTALLHGWTRFVSMQNHYNLIYREEEREMIPMCVDMGVGILPWSPLARGFLAGNRTRGGGGDTTRAKSDQMAHDFYYTEADFAVVDRLKEVGARLGKSPAQLALAWILQHPEVTSPIVGATKPQQLSEALEAVDIKLSPDDVDYLEDPYVPKNVLGHR